MKPKQLIFHDEARDKIRRGVDALAEAVKVTLGPRVIATGRKDSPGEGALNPNAAMLEF